MKTKVMVKDLCPEDTFDIKLKVLAVTDDQRGYARKLYVSGVMDEGTRYSNAFYMSEDQEIEIEREVAVPDGWFKFLEVGIDDSGLMNQWWSVGPGGYRFFSTGGRVCDADEMMGYLNKYPVKIWGTE